MNRNRNLFGCLILFSLGAGISVGQPQHYRFEQLPPETGLNSGSINHILQDHKGFLWLGTWTGLVRYDGYTAKIYKQEPGNTPTLKSNKITALYEDRQKRLWIGTNYSGFYLYDREKETFIRFFHDPANRNSLSSNNVWAILEDREGMLWIGTEAGLNRFDPATRAFICYDHDPRDSRSLSHSFVYSILEMPDGSLWVGTETGLNRLVRGKNGGSDFFIRYSLAPNGLSPDDYLTHNFIRTLTPAIHTPQAFWVGASIGLKLVRYSNENLAEIKTQTWLHDPGNPESLSNSFVPAVLPKDKNQVWVATYDGFNLLDIPSGKFTHFTAEKKHPFSLNNNGIKSLYQDRTGILWIGTEKGVNKLNLHAKPFFGLRLNESDKTDHVITCIRNAPDQKGCWVGTRGGGLNFVPSGPNGLDRQGLWSYRLSPPKFADLAHIVSDLLVDKSGWLWVATQGAGILKMKTAEIPAQSGAIRKITQYVKSSGRLHLSDDYIMSLFESTNGDIWLGYWDNGLGRYDPVRDTFFQYTETAGFEVDLKAFPVVHLMETRENTQNFLWIGTRGGGVFKLRLDEKTNTLRLISKYHYGGVPGISNNFINALVQGRKGEIWIGTENGLNALHPGGATEFYFEKDGLANDAIQSILSDDSEEIWVSTLQGLSRIRPGRQADKIKNFDVYDGLLDNYFDDKSAVGLTNGYFVFGGINGLNYFNPKAIKKDTIPPAIVISDFKLFNQSTPVGPWNGRKAILSKSISETTSIELSHRDHVFSFEFTGLQFSEPQKIRYAYRLEGFIEDWVYTTAQQRIAHFTNLPYDDFVFRVKAANQDGVWSEPVSLRLKIRPPFWLTHWAMAGYFMLFLALLYGVRRITKLRAEFRHRLELEHLEREKMEEVNKVKLQFFTNISHELRTPLTLILSPLEQLIQEKTGDTRLQKVFTRMHNNANRLLTMINQLLDIRKNEAGLLKMSVSKGNLVFFIREIALSFKELAQQRNIRYHFTADHPDVPLWFDPDQLEKVVFNLLSNAFKFTKDGGEVRISVGLDPVGAHALIRVKDTGIGIPENGLSRIFDHFFQAENHPEGPWKSGSGIGLTLAKNIVEKHKGLIEVESREGQGTCFSVYLPLGNEHFSEAEKKENPVQREVSIFDQEAEGVGRAGDEDETFPAVAAPVNPGASKNAPLILLVEDNPDIRTYLRENFERQYRIIEAANGLEGLDRARAENPDLIVADIAMPQMDGLEMCSGIKSDMATSHIPVILLTARTSLVSKVDGLETGADDYVTKPFNLELLAARVKNLIESRKRLRGKFAQSFDLTTPGGEKLHSLDQQFLERIKAEVEKNLSDEHFSVDQLAGTLLMSRMHLYRKLKALSGYSPNQVIRTIRLKKAAQLLAEGRYNVSEVTYMVGYNDLKSFREQFKKEFGVSPSEYGAG